MKIFPERLRMFDLYAIRNKLHFVLSFLIVAFSRGTRVNQMTREAMVGDPYIDLVCPLDPLRNESATYRWSRDGSVLAACVSCSNGTVNITKFARQSHWIFSLGRDFHFRIRQPDISQDAGIYICTDDNRNEVVRVTLKIFVPASTAVITTEPQLIDRDLYVTEGKDVVVTCSANGKPAPDVNLQWRNVTMESFHFNVSKEYGKINQVDQTKARMYFVASRRQDGWKIQCLAHSNKSEHWSSQAYIHIYVQYLSNVSVFVIPSEARQGDRVVLLCQGEASPETNLTWTKVGSQWTRSAMKPVILENVSFKDAGTYVCTSRNKAGTQSRKTSLLVKISPSREVIRAGQSGSSMLQAVLIFTVLIFLFLLAILSVVIHFICHSAVYNNAGPNKRRLPTLPAAYPSFANPSRTTIEERSNSQISMKQISPSSSVTSSLPANLIPPRPKAKLPKVPFRSQLVDCEHSYMNTSVTQPDYLEVVDEKNDKEDLLYEDPDKNCFQSLSRDKEQPSNTNQILLCWD